MFRHTRLFGGWCRPFVMAFGGLAWFAATALGHSGIPAPGGAPGINPALSANFSSISEIGSGVGDVGQMTFGPDGRLYIATFGAGVWRYDYNPAGVLTNKTKVVPDAISNSGGVNGSLGVAFHQDTVNNKTYMYIAPAVAHGGGLGSITQSIYRLTDDNNDGTWGGAGDVAQAIVNNLQVNGLHEINQLQVRNNSLYAAIGGRTQNGGLPGASPNQSATGEHSYTGTVSFIQDLTQLSDTTTANTAGFNIANHKRDTQMFSSADSGKLRIFSTGLRNDYGLAFDQSGQLWVSMNENENPQKPDTIYKTNYKDDHGFAKGNDNVGDWKVDGDDSIPGAGNDPSAVALTNGFFGAVDSHIATLGNNAAAGGLDFTYNDPDQAGHPFVSRWSKNDVWVVDPDTGNTMWAFNNIHSPLDVLADAQGNLLVGAFGSEKIYRVTVIPEPASMMLLGAGAMLLLRRQRRVDTRCDAPQPWRSRTAKKPVRTRLNY